MAKAGRKRKAGQREPNGRLQRQKSESAVYWQRERDALRVESRKPEWSTPLGVLFRAGKITPSQMQAGTRFAEDRKRADAALGIRGWSAQAQNVGAVQGTPGEDSEDETRRKQRAVEQYDKVCAMIGEASKPLRALQWIVVYERTPDDYAQVLDLVDGLNSLARLYQIRG